MSLTILAFAKSFVGGRLTASTFAEAYAELWRIERDNNLLLRDDAKESECLSSIFCLVDLYNPDSGREEYELNEEQLLAEVAKLVNGLEDSEK